MFRLFYLHFWRSYYLAFYYYYYYYLHSTLQFICFQLFTFSFICLCVSWHPVNTCHTAQQRCEECYMCRSYVLHCELTLVILCKTVLEPWLTATASAWEQHDRGESNLSSSVHPSFPVSPPIVLVKHFTYTAICLILFLPSTHLILTMVPSQS